jgi:cytochrome c peroxidase
LRIFLAEPASRPLTEDTVSAGGVGNCIACHAAPVFTDFRFHNNGAAQDEYDAVHGAGAFATIHVPELSERGADPVRFLPPSAAHPDAAGIFRRVPAADRPDVTDLGVWNIFANDALPGSQASLQATLCDPASLVDCTPSALLPRTIALFKTPSLRDLSHSGPYLHTGQQDTLEDVIAFYGRVAGLARAGSVRNADPELAAIAVTPADSAALGVFLRALDEDYE